MAVISASAVVLSYRGDPGGDGSGLVIGPHGVRRIPPLDPNISAHVKAVLGLVGATTRAPVDEGLREELTRLATATLHLLVPRIEANIGALAEGSTITVLDEDGDGFSCGTPPRGPFPVPRPHWNVFSRDLAAGARSNAAALETLRAASE